MVDFAKELLPINIEEEMRQSYMAYAMRVIIGRALPDVRDGLKPVHRRVLYAMQELGIYYNKPYKKAARVVGDVIGKYHPHGESAVYDALVRMAQLFSMRYPLIDGQGNFGSVDGDPPAAMRYTEVRMSKIAHALLADLDLDTVDFIPNYDEEETEPAVLPTRSPNLLVNGTTGIAVGMATNIPPHNLGEVVDALLALLVQPELDINALMRYLPGPDFPTAGLVNGIEGISDAYHTGRGRILLRARHEIEQDKHGKESIVVTELPYQVNKAKLIEQIAELVKEKKVEGITEIRDESDKDGMRIVIEVRRGDNAAVLANNLYQLTPLETAFNFNMVALLGGEPRLLNLKQILEAFLQHRRVVITRRTLFELKRARARAHVLEGLAVALANLDAVIALIKASPTPAQARQALMTQGWQAEPIIALLARADSQQLRPDQLDPESGLHGGLYRLSEVQARAILDLQLQRLTALEQHKINDEYLALAEQVRALLMILRNPERLREVLQEELTQLRTEFADPRRTELIGVRQNFRDEDLIDDTALLVTLSHSGYIKAQPQTSYVAQKRGGRGKLATGLKDEDRVEQFVAATAHDTLLCFSSLGRLYWLKVYELPRAERNALGKPVVNLLPLAAGERITALLPVREFTADRYVFMVTRRGTVKKTALLEFSRPRPGGIIAVGLRDDDRLMGAALTDGQQEILLCSDAGKALRFPEVEARPLGRTAAGVRGMRLQSGQAIIALIVIVPDGEILTLSANGYGKRTPVSEFPARGRGSQGVIAMQLSTRNGQLVGALQVQERDEVMLMTNGGTLIRTRCAEIKRISRNTQGVKLISLQAGEHLVSAEKIETTEIIIEEDEANHEAGV
jgi:DNA gyrase subunit A